MELGLKGKVAIVTGGTEGIGKETAAVLLREGAKVAICSRRPQAVEATVAELKGISGDVLGVPCDVAKPEDVGRLVDATVQRFGRLDILVNNAGSTVRKPPQDFTLDDWNSVMDLNLTGAFLCARAAYPLMQKAGHGKVINIGSILSLFGAPYAPAYCASKGGIVQLTKSLALAWARDGIQANAVLPGWIDTELTVTARNEVPGLNDRVLARTPAGRWGVPQDLAGIAVFLASPASDFVTGAAIPVDGGYSAA